MHSLTEIHTLTEMFFSTFADEISVEDDGDGEYTLRIDNVAYFLQTPEATWDGYRVSRLDPTLPTLTDPGDWVETPVPSAKDGSWKTAAEAIAAAARHFAMRHVDDALEVWTQIHSMPDDDGPLENTSS